MEDLAKIKDRIAKLLSMAADSSSPNEAAIAAGRARSLMDKYQVSEFDVTKKVETEFATLPAFPDFDDQLDMFRAHLSVAVATYNDCIARYEYTLLSKPRGLVKGKRVLLMGFKSDVELAAQMYARLIQNIERLRKVWFKEQGIKYTTRLGRNFADGAVAIITQRLNAMTKERDTVLIGTGTSLMVIKKEAVEDHFGEAKYGKASPRKKVSAVGVAALMAGRKAGASIEIVPLVTD
jgi:hypothetical protein